MALFRKKSTPVLGIDISSTAIKLIELRRQDTRYRVESYAVEPLPQNAVVEKNIANLEAVTETLRTAVKRSGTKLRDAAVAVSGSSAISRTLTLAANLGADELEAQVGLQADQHIPYPLEEVNLDFQVLGPTSAGNTEEVEVLLVASRSENVEVRVDALEPAGLKARLVDVESYALEHAPAVVAPEIATGPDQTVAILDIGATMTTLTVFERNRIVYTRDQVFGGRQLTDEIMRRFGLTYEEAGRAKRQGGLPDTYQEEVLTPFREAMAQQVSRSLQFFFGASQHNSVDQVILAGGCAAIPGAAEVIEESVGAQTVVANPFNRMSVASRIRPQVLADDAPSLIIATGLALRSFD